MATGKESLQDLLNLLGDSLKRDEKMSKEISGLESNGKMAESDGTQIKVNQNVSLEELLGALKECMVDTIVAMDQVMVAGRQNGTSTCVVIQQGHM